jgi:WD40 repeat protein
MRRLISLFAFVIIVGGCSAISTKAPEITLSPAGRGVIQTGDSSWIATLPTLTVTPTAISSPSSPTAILMSTLTTIPPTPNPYQIAGILNPDEEYIIVLSGNGFSAISIKDGKEISLGDPFDLDGQISPDGKKVAFISFPDKQTINIVDLFNGILQPIAADKECPPEQRPGWSPDGTMLVTTCESGLIIQKVRDGSIVGKIVFNFPNMPFSFSGNFPSWSPDGKRIGYLVSDTRMSYYRRDKIELVESNCIYQPGKCMENAKDIYELSHNGMNRFDWVGDHEIIIYDQNNNKLIIVDVSTKQVVAQYALDKIALEEFELSPDKQWIAFGASDDQGACIYKLSVDLKSLIKIYHDKGRLNFTVVGWLW